MRRVVRRRSTVVTVQTWTVTWAEEMPEADPAPGTSPAPLEATPALPPAPAPDVPPPPCDASRAAPDQADPAG